MLHKWLNKKQNQKLILFFNGWSMDENPLKPLNFSHYDIVVFYNYQNIDIDNFLLDEINKYPEIILIGWSMGVWAGALCAKYFNIKNSIAINGTLSPIDDNFGIPHAVYKGTIDNFSLKYREKFYKRMFKTSEEFEKFLKIEVLEIFSINKMNFWPCANMLKYFLTLIMIGLLWANMIKFSPI